MSYRVDEVRGSQYRDISEMKRHERIILDADERELQRNARLQARKESYQEGAEKIKDGAKGTIASDVFINATAKGTDLASKTAKTATRAGRWAGAFAVLTGYDSAARKLVDNTDSIREAAKKEPLATAFLYLTGAIATLTGANSLFDFTKKQIAKRNPELTQKVSKHIDDVRAAINKTWINKEIIKPINNLSKKVADAAPTLTKATSKVAPFVPAALMAYSFVNGVKEAIDTDKEYAKNYNAMKSAQESALLKQAVEAIKNYDNQAIRAYAIVASDFANQQYKPEQVSENDINEDDNLLAETESTDEIERNTDSEVIDISFNDSAPEPENDDDEIS